MLGPAAADPDAVTGLVDDDLPFDDSEEAQAEWEQTQAEWIATGFPGCEPAFPVAQDEPRAVDEGFVIVEPDEVKTKAQPSTGRKEVWTYTAVVLVAGLRYAFAEATAEGLWLQVSALLLELGVLSGERRLLVLGDGAAWIRAWFEGLGIPSKAMVLCWWHLRKRCYESMSSAGGPKDRRRGFEKELLGRLWRGEVGAAIELLRGASEWVRNPTAVEELIAYLEKRRAYIPDYQQRQRAGLWIASTRVEKYNDWAVSARCKHQGMSWSPQGVLALAALEAARRNGELDAWRRDRALAGASVAGTDSQGRLIAEPAHQLAVARQFFRFLGPPCPRSEHNLGPEILSPSDDPLSWSALPGVDPVLRVHAAEAASVSGEATSPGGWPCPFSISDSAQMAAGSRPLDLAGE